MPCISPGASLRQFGTSTSCLFQRAQPRSCEAAPETGLERDAGPLTTGRSAKARMAQRVAYHVGKSAPADGSVRLK
jgi:hypothetical protein